MQEFNIWITRSDWNPKSKSFRNFIIIFSVFFSVVIIGLVTYFILTNYVENSLSSLLSKEQKTVESKQEQESTTINDTNITIDDTNTANNYTDTVILSKEKLSTDQKRVISLFGYPDQFTIIFDEGNNNNRIDSWIYCDMNALFMFEDGAYSDSEEYFAKESQQSSYKLLPQDFTYGMTPFEVETLIGQKGTENFEEITGLNVLSFGEGEIICIFNPDSKLIVASKQNKLSGGI